MIRVEHVPLGPVTTIMTTIPSAHLQDGLYRCESVLQLNMGQTCAAALARVRATRFTPPCRELGARCQQDSTTLAAQQEQRTPTTKCSNPILPPAVRPAPKLSDAPTSSLPLSQHPDSRMPPTPPRRKPKLAPGSSIFTRLPVCSWLRPAEACTTGAECNMTRTGWDMDPFAIFSFGKKVFRTRAIGHSRNPVQLSILDWDKHCANDHIGNASFDVNKLAANAPQVDLETGLYPACGAHLRLPQWGMRWWSAYVDAARTWSSIVARRAGNADGTESRLLNASDAAMGRGVTADCLEHLHLPWPHRHLQGLDGESPSLCTGDRELGLAHAGPIASDSSTRDPSSTEQDPPPPPPWPRPSLVDVKSFPSHAIDSKQGAISVVRAIMPNVHERDPGGPTTSTSEAVTTHCRRRAHLRLPHLRRSHPQQPARQPRIAADEGGSPCASLKEWNRRALHDHCALSNKGHIQHSICGFSALLGLEVLEGEETSRG
ncbi:hypothetical protein DFP72DRAFT_1059349 [Ephemerocybe angulata]|uniref:Uncharacterized protein n=1 Tax=Ephemerocybe angulata TaxID=980116 RepID=A0A8H6IG58_9AGAR|nr:hypothetical protein DFP72DRAFT_1059349 [Tulosesus angulatus]